MLVLPHRSLLNDGILSAEESLLRFKEKEAKALQQFKLQDQDLLTDEDARLGRRIPHTKLVEEVVRMSGYKVWAEDSNNVPGTMNFYTMRDGQKVCLQAGFYKGILNEYTIIYEDARGLPYHATRGWRDVLKRLLDKKVIRYSDVVKTFGNPTNTPAQKWEQQTQHLR